MPLCFRVGWSGDETGWWLLFTRFSKRRVIRDQIIPYWNSTGAGVRPCLPMANDVAFIVAVINVWFSARKRTTKRRCIVHHKNGGALPLSAPRSAERGWENAPAPSPLDSLFKLPLL